MAEPTNQDQTIKTPTGTGSLWIDYLTGKGGNFKGTTGFRGGQLRRIDAIQQILNAMQDTDKMGTTEKRNINEWETGRQGGANQSAVSRGLFNTTVLDSARRGISSDAQKMRLGVDEVVQDRRNALRSAIAQILSGNYGGQANPHKPNFGEILGSSFANSFGNSSGQAATQLSMTGLSAI